MAKKRIGMIGGGVASLATALKLTELRDDVEIVIIEKEKGPGGLARSISIEGIPADMGPHRIFTEIPEIKKFLKEFLSDEWFVVKRKSQMYYNGGYFDYPIKVGGALKSLGVGTTMRFGFGAVFANLLPGGSSEGKTFDSVMKGAFGSPVYNDLIRPYTEKVWKMSPSEIDAEVARLRVSAGGLSKIIRSALGADKADDPSAVKEFHYLPNGFQDLVDKYTRVLADKPVTIVTDALVTDVEPLEGGRMRVKWDGGEDEFDFCFNTIPVDDLIRMLHAHKPNDQAKSIADSLRYLSMICVFLVADKPSISDNSWLYFPDKELIFNRGYEGKNFNPHIKSDNAMLCLEVTCYRGDETWKRTNEDIAAQVVKEFCATGMLDEKNVVKTETIRLSHAYPILHKGFKKDLRVLWDYLAEFPGLITLGRQGLFQHNNTDHSQYMGFLAAELYDKSDTPTSDWYNKTIKRFDNFRIVD